MTPRSILLIEDQAEVRRMLCKALEGFKGGVRVIELPSGEEALLVLSRQPVDLAIIDVRLAGMSGLDFLARARQRQPGLKTILMTGMNDADTRQQLAAAGANAFFFKPLEMPVFLQAIEHCLEGTQAGASSSAEARDLDAAPVPASAEDPAAAPDLRGRLEELRSTYRATALLLLGSAREVLAVAGTLPAGVEPAALSSPLADLLGAGAQLSTCLGVTATDDLLIIRGSQFDLCLAPIGTRGSLAWFNAEGEGLRSPALLQEVSQALAPFLQTGDDTPPASSDHLGEEQDERHEQPEAGSPDFADLFSQAGDLSADTQSIDSFWTQAILQEDDSGPRERGRLSYEQARDLGLAPDG